MNSREDYSFFNFNLSSPATKAYCRKKGAISCISWLIPIEMIKFSVIYTICDFFHFDTCVHSRVSAMITPPLWDDGLTLCKEL